MQIIETKDGSHTLYSPQFDEIYHSRNGAMSESEHVFINAGLKAMEKKEIDVFELGFGTGLNAFMTWIYAESQKIKVNYHSIELYPLSEDVISLVNYPMLIAGHKDKFDKIHKVGWDKSAELSPYFGLYKILRSVLDLSMPPASVDIVFFDAFSPERQPELWTAEIFRKMHDMLRPGGILVTYCSKSAVRKNMQEAGFSITKLPGPQGKRDMVRAVR